MKFTEAHDFQMLEDLPEGVYDYLWVRLHPSSYYPVTSANRQIYAELHDLV